MGARPAGPAAPATGVVGHLSALSRPVGVPAATAMIGVALVIIHWLVLGRFDGVTGLLMAIAAAAMFVPAYALGRGWRASAARLDGERARERASSEAHMATIEALALAIESRDRTSQQDLHRFRAYAEGLGEAAGMGPEDRAGLATAALLHDIGNLAVPEHILSKPSRLTHDEYEKIKIHPRVGAAIVRAIPFPSPIAPMILSHHERWDGRGYPSGLKGHEIPLGARVLGVVDCFTSLLSDRPHRPARAYAEAIATLRENAGTALDPALVELFIDVLPAAEAQLVAADEPPRPASRAGGTSETAAPTILQDIAVAHHEDQVLFEITQALGSSLRVSDTVALISSRLATLVPFSTFAVFMLDRLTGTYVCRHAAGVQQSSVRSRSASALDELATWVHPITGDRRDHGQARRLQSAMVCPMVINRRTIGALAVYHVAPAIYTADHRRLVARVAGQAAAVFANAVVFEETEEQSLTDALTGLPNRRYMDAHLLQQIARAQRRLEPLTVVLLDMDRFKSLNDEFGHQAGDRALREVARVLREGLRVYDLCARFAGDEFVVVLGDCDPVCSARRRLDLQDAVAAIVFEPVPGKRATLEISAGAASYPVDGTTPEALLSEADRRMYLDKAQRKGQAALVPAMAESRSA